MEWNNLINERLTFQDGTSWDVREKYEFNRNLIDLRRQPAWVVSAMDNALIDAFSKPIRRHGYNYFVGFARQHGALRLVADANSVVPALMATYGESR